MRARYAGICFFCAKPYRVGAQIERGRHYSRAQHDGYVGYVHSDCLAIVKRQRGDLAKIEAELKRRGAA